MGRRKPKRSQKTSQLSTIQQHFIQLEMMSLLLILMLGWLASFVITKRFLIPPLILSMWFISAIHLANYTACVQSLGVR